MLSFSLYFRRKQFTGEAYFIRRMAYITDLRSKSISLWVARIPMRNPLRAAFLVLPGKQQREESGCTWGKERVLYCDHKKRNPLLCKERER